MFGNNFLNIVRCYAAVKSTVRINDYNRTERAETETSGLYNCYLIGKSEALNILDKSFLNFMTSRRGTTCTAAD